MVVMALALKILLSVYFSSLTNRFYGGNNLNLTLEKNFLCHFFEGEGKEIHGFTYVGCFYEVWIYCILHSSIIFTMFLFL